MKRFIGATGVLVGLLCMSSPALATNPKPQAQAESNAVAASNSQSSATGVGIGVGIGKGGNAKANSSANSTNVNAPSQTSTQVGIQGQQYEGSYQGTSGSYVTIEGGPRQAPGLSQAGDVSNNTCLAHVGGGVTSPFGGAQVMVPKLDVGCHLVRMHNALAKRGYTAEALELLKQDEYVQKAFETTQARRAGVSATVTPASTEVPKAVTTIETTNFGATPQAN